MILNISNDYPYEQDALSLINKHLEDVISSGYKYLYIDNPDLSVYYYESFDKYTGERSTKSFSISGLYLSKNGDSSREVSELKISISSESNEIIADRLADLGYRPISRYKQTERSYGIDGIEPSMYTELVNGQNLPRYKVGAVRNWLNCLLVCKGQANVSEKKSGWALVKYEEVDSPE